jgi:cytochrome c551/c552
MIACKICHQFEGKVVKATLIAARYEGGDEDGHVEYVPICNSHAPNWFDGVAEEARIPFIELPEAHHKAHPDTSLLYD